MHLKGALHVHTTCSDGRLTPAETIRVYEAMGFDFIALTDHDHLLGHNSYHEIESIQTGLLIFTGIELTVFEKGYVHINRIPGDQDVLHIFNHPAELGLPFFKVIARIQAIKRRYPLDAIEITSKGFKTPEYDVPEIDLVKVATDDAHTRLMCGRAWIEMDCVRNRDRIIQAIRAGDFWNCYV
ncbi:MAG: PHP domain-containing protein [Desulfatirhabdiaceae bacterium]